MEEIRLSCQLKRGGEGDFSIDSISFARASKMELTEEKRIRGKEEETTSRDVSEKRGRVLDEMGSLI